MTNNERRSHFGWLRVELEDSTLEEARWYFEAAEGAQVAVDAFSATVVKTQRDLTPAEEREREQLRRDERRYWGD